MSLHTSNTSGFSLIELTLVLFILALAAHLGAREFSRVRGDRLARAASRQLDEVTTAVYDASAAEPRGFLCDMGRLPIAAALPGGGATTNSLSELYVRPEYMGECRARRATVDNLVPGTPAEISDPSLLVVCGWGGPYVTLPQGTDRLRDPWGNPYENPDPAGQPRLLGVDGNPVATGASIAAIRHFGADGMDDAARKPDSFWQQDASRTFETNSAGILLTFDAGTVTNAYWYAPLGDKITGGTVPIDLAASQASIGGLTPGVRFVKVFFTSGAARTIQVTLRAGRDTPVNLHD